MGLILKLKDTVFTTPGLPQVGDYGKLYTDGAVGIWKMLSDAAKYTDDSGANNHLAYAGTSAPAFANGVLSLPDPGANHHRLQMAMVTADLTKTFAMLCKPGAFNQYLLHNMPVNMFCNTVGTVQGVYYDSGAVLRQISLGAVVVSGWSFILMSVRADGIDVSINGGSFSSHAFASTNGAPAASGVRAYYGATGSAGARGDLAFLAQYERSFSQNEAISLYRGVRAWAKSTKNITV